jgi:hypothetical protein
VWGTNIVWGTAANLAYVVFGTMADFENIVWGTALDGENIVWGTSGGEAVIYDSPDGEGSDVQLTWEQLNAPVGGGAEGGVQ